MQDLCTTDVKLLDIYEEDKYKDKHIDEINICRVQCNDHIFHL